MDCARMLAAQAVYAPDPQVIRIDTDVAFGRMLHAMLPEDAFDRGPVDVGIDGMMVADVRIDNRDEVAAALAIGDEAARLPDAALLARALERWGLDALERVVGDFAFAWWDRTRRRLILARDALGQRPLHFHAAASFTAFASLPRGLHALAEVPRAPDEESLAAFAALRPEPADRSFFAGINKVPPGHYVSIEAGQVELHRWWNPPTTELRLADPRDYVETVRALLDQAVAARLRGAGGRVAAHLSAGLDSGAVAATAARLLAPEGRRVIGYTAVPREGFAGGIEQGGMPDEGPLAGEVAAMYDNLDQILIRSGARSPIDALERTSQLYDRPLLNIANFSWANAILDDARSRGISVLLTGSMGNAGFSHDGFDLLGTLFRRGRWWSLVREAASLVRGGTRAGTVAAAILNPLLPSAVLKAIARARRRGTDLSAFSLASAEHLRAASAPRSGPRDPGGRHLAMLGLVDPGNYIKGMLGGWGIDVRDPTADRRLIEFCLRVPADQYLSAGVPRALARRALADRLPASVLGERRRGEQAADWHEGVSAARADLGAELEHIARDPVASRVLDLDRGRALIADWPEDPARWRRDDVTSRYRQALLRGIAIGHFIRKTTGTN